MMKNLLAWCGIAVGLCGAIITLAYYASTPVYSSEPEMYLERVARLNEDFDIVRDTETGCEYFYRDGSLPVPRYEASVLGGDLRVKGCKIQPSGPF